MGSLDGNDWPRKTVRICVRSSGRYGKKVRQCSGHEQEAGHDRRGNLGQRLPNDPVFKTGLGLAAVENIGVSVTRTRLHRNMLASMQVAVRLQAFKGSLCGETRRTGMGARMPMCQRARAQGSKKSAQRCTGSHTKKKVSSGSIVLNKKSPYYSSRCWSPVAQRHRQRCAKHQMAHAREGARETSVLPEHTELDLMFCDTSATRPPDATRRRGDGHLLYTRIRRISDGNDSRSTHPTCERP